MPVGYTQLPELLPVAGVRLASVAAGVRYAERNDMVVMELAEHSQCAAVFTRNAFCAAPVIVARQHLQQTAPRYFLINSGNANAGTGVPGLAAARRCCVALAEVAACNAVEVLPFSTGVIGEQLPVERMEAVMGPALQQLSAQGWSEAAHAIMTTDTVAKGLSRTIRLEDHSLTVTGMVKGAGMIRPDMATMLAYIATDAKLDRDVLQQLLEQAVEGSFNRITVDGDTSTNDACVLVATGAAGNAPLRPGSEAYDIFAAVIGDVCRQLAQLIVRDAEGASKFVTVNVRGGRDREECLQVAYTVAHSPLVKTAMFASDPNWGRILAAVGRAGLEQLQIDSIRMYLGEVCIVRDGGVDPDYREQDGQQVMSRDEIHLRIELGRGDAAEQLWTSDLSHEYVRINAEYRS